MSACEFLFLAAAHIHSVTSTEYNTKKLLFHKLFSTSIIPLRRQQTIFAYINGAQKKEQKLFIGNWVMQTSHLGVRQKVTQTKTTTICCASKISHTKTRAACISAVAFEWLSIKSIIFIFDHVLSHIFFYFVIFTLRVLLCLLTRISFVFVLTEKKKKCRKKLLFKAVWRFEKPRQLCAPNLVL